MQSRKLYEYLNPSTANMQIMESQDGKDLFMQGLFIQGDVKIKMDEYIRKMRYLELLKVFVHVQAKAKL